MLYLSAPINPITKIEERIEVEINAKSRFNIFIKNPKEG